MTNKEETSLAWADIEHFCSWVSEHYIALGNICEQAGRDAYLIDKAMNYKPLPGPSPLDRARLEDIPRFSAAKAYAGQLLTTNASKFGYDFPMKFIVHQWLLGYDKAHCEALANPQEATPPSPQSLASPRLSPTSSLQSGLIP